MTPSITKPKSTKPARKSTQAVPPLITGVMSGVLRAVVGAYGLSTAGFLLLRLLVGERWVLIGLFNSFGHLLLIPALVLLPLYVLLRQWLLVALLLPASAAFLIFYGARFLPASPPPAPDHALEVMTYNILARSGRYEPVLDILRTSDADLIALQELGPAAEAVIREELAADYPHMALHLGSRPTAGQGVLSRYPILEDEYWQYDDIPNPLGHQRLVVEIAGRPVTVYNIHLTHPGMTGEGFFVPGYRRQELQALLQRAARETNPVLLLGDFNLTDLSEDYQLIRQAYQDAYVAAGRGLGWTFPNRVDDGTHAGIFTGWLPDLLPIFPLMRLDYVFVDATWQVHAARVWPTSGGSDHRPVLASLSLR